MAILFEAMRSYAGPASLAKIAQQWGVEMAAAPGEEVDPGLLQYSLDPKAGVVHTRWGYVRKEAAHIDKFKWRRGTSSRIRADIRQNANAAFVRALVGALYVHGGRESVRSFVDAHILARRVDLESLFSFKLPTRELAMLCAREGFEAPVARLLSETGRHSRTPVFVVGIYSGQDKLGEGTGASLDFARLKASMNALKAWYLYSPGAKSRVPSDMLSEGAKPWQPVHIDMGEVI
ncbi:54S ribosomal protein L3 like [Verticillium longisporum]|nr:54S ribosomal protein L3 like [Verticillium longisporum]